MAKASQEEAEYSDNGDGIRRCLFCSMYFDGSAGTCTAVEGSVATDNPVRPMGGCKFWENVVTGKRRPDGEPRQDLGGNDGDHDRSEQ